MSSFAKDVVGAAQTEKLKVIKTKNMSVFAARFAPDVDDTCVKTYLEERLKRQVQCKKIFSEKNRFASFHISAECLSVGEMYDPQLWPEGIFVRRFYEPRRPKKNNNPSSDITSKVNSLPNMNIPGNTSAVASCHIGRASASMV